MKRMRIAGAAYGYPVGSLIRLLAVWQPVVLVFRPSDYLLPSPLAVAEGIVQQRDLLGMHLLVTVHEMLVGFLRSVLITSDGSRHRGTTTHASGSWERR